jgi:hypothetical protein
MVIVYYVCDCIPRPEDNPKYPGLNQLDRGLLDTIWKKRGRKLSQNKKEALENTVLMFSDLQIITSLAILSAGFSQLHCSISSYHWQLLVYTAWFSSVTHLTTLTMIRHYFRRNNTIVRNVRVFLMLCVLVMLTVALLPTGHRKWISTVDDTSTAGAPAMCYMTDLSGLDTASPQTDAMIFSIIVLWTSYITRVIKLYATSSATARRHLRTKPGAVLKGWIRWAEDSKVLMPLHDFLSIQLVILRALFDFFESLMWEVRVSPASSL